MDYTIIVTLLSVIGTVANVYKKRWCFIIWLFTNAFWFGYDLAFGLYSQAILFGIYFVLAIVGLLNWGKEKKKGDFIKESRELHIKHYPPPTSPKPLPPKR